MHVEYKYRVTYPIKFQFRSTYSSQFEIFEKVVQSINAAYPNIVDICNTDTCSVQNYFCTPTIEINTEFEKLPVLYESCYRHLNTHLRRADCTVYVDVTVSCEISTLYSDADTLSQDEQIKIFKTVFSPYFAAAELTKFDFSAYTVLVR